MGHEYCGIVEEVGKEVRNIKRGQFMVGSFAMSDNTCVICKDGEVFTQSQAAVTPPIVETTCLSIKLAAEGLVAGNPLSVIWHMTKIIPAAVRRVTHRSYPNPPALALRRPSQTCTTRLLLTLFELRPQNDRDDNRVRYDLAQT